MCRVYCYVEYGYTFVSEVCNDDTRRRNKTRVEVFQLNDGTVRE